MTDPRPSAGQRILIVEDENIVAMDIERGLKTLGYNVVGVVNNGADALSIAEKKNPDLILMDIQIKGPIDGIETSVVVREKLNVPVIFLTAHADEATLQRAKQAGPFGYILKPFEETELHTAIQVALQKHRSVGEEQKKMVSALEKSEELFSLMVESVRDYAIIILDLNGKVHSWNKGAERIYGYSAVEAQNMHFSVLYSEEEALNGAPQWELSEANRSGSLEFEGWKIRKDGTRFWGAFLITRMIDKQNIQLGYSLVTRDLSERRRSEERLRMANESLERRVEERTQRLTEALRTRDEFLSIASHELKNPLTTLCLQLRLLNRFIETCFQDEHLTLLKTSPEATFEKLTKAIGSCERQSLRLASLIDELLDITRIRTGKFELRKELLDFEDLLKEVVDRMKHEYPSLEKLQIFRPQESAIGKWDRSRLEQVVVNLLSNAVKYGNNEKIEVIIENSPDRRFLRFTVKDHGIGIDPAHQKKIFDIFERVDSDKKVAGLGLGLYIVRQIVSAHGGNISVQSLLGAGSSFIVDIPTSLSEDKELQPSNIAL